MFTPLSPLCRAQPWIVLIVGLLALPALGLAQTQSFKPRAYYRAPLEPKTSVFHSSGQIMAQSFRDYTATVGPEPTPVFHMDYIDLS